MLGNRGGENRGMVMGLSSQTLRKEICKLVVSPGLSSGKGGGFFGGGYGNRLK